MLEFRVPEAVFEDNSLHPSALKLYLLMRNAPTISLEAAARRLGISTRYTEKLRKDLQAKGYIYVAEQGSGPRPNSYGFRDQPAGS